MFQMVGDYLEAFLRRLIVFVTNFLPVKVIRDERGTPFLYRYHIFSFGNDGPGLCIHHFVRSDPERGYHDHPWNHALSFILAGYYEERILDLSDNKSFNTYMRNRYTFNYLKGVNRFHRVMIEKDAWTLFAFGGRKKVWGMIDLNGEYHQMSKTISDQDGGWWNVVGKGFGVDHHVPHPGNVISTVDVLVIDRSCSKILLIKRGKNPYKDVWAFPGGRIEKKDADIESAARRELEEETSLKDYDLVYWKTIGNNHRDPRGFCLTNVFVANLNERPTFVRAGDDAIDFDWFSFDNLPEMAFDHQDILDSYLTTM